MGDGLELEAWRDAERNDLYIWSRGACNAALSAACLQDGVLLSSYPLFFHVTTPLGFLLTRGLLNITNIQKTGRCSRPQLGQV